MADKQVVYGIAADNKIFKKKMNEVDSRMKQSKKTAGGVFKKLKAGWLGVTAAIGGTVLMIKKSLDAYATQQKAEQQLAQALKNTGDYTKSSFNNLKKYASELQKITTVGDETSLQAMQLGLSMGISAGNIKDATKNAIGLSKAYGLDLKTSMKAVSEIQQGNFQTLGRYDRRIMSATTNAERMRIAQEDMANGFKIAQSETETFTGAVQQMKNSLGDVQEVLGKQFANAIAPAVKEFNKWVQSAQGIKTIDAISKGLFITIQYLIFSFKTVGREFYLYAAKPIIESVKLVMKVIDIFKDKNLSLKDKFSEIGQAGGDAFKNYGKAVKDTAQNTIKDFTKLKNSVIDLFKKQKETQNSLAKGGTVNSNGNDNGNGKTEATINKEVDAYLKSSQTELEIENNKYNKMKQLAQGNKDELLAIEKRHSENIAKIQMETFKNQVSATKTALGDIAGLMSSSNQTLFNIGKASAIANATISSYEAIAKTMASVPFPLNIPLAAAQAAASALQISKIASTPPPKAAKGALVDGATNIIAGEAGRELVLPNYLTERIINMTSPQSHSTINFNISGTVIDDMALKTFTKKIMNSQETIIRNNEAY